MCLNKIRYGEILYSIENPDSFKQFESEEAAEEWGREKYGDWAKDYDRRMNEFEEIFCLVNSYISHNPIQEYCGYSYEEVNLILRKTFGYDSLPESKIRNGLQLIGLLVLELLRAPRVPENIIVYRRVCKEFIQEMIQINKEGQGVQTREKGFLSTSLLQDGIAKDKRFSDNYMLKIFVPKGTPGVYVNVVNGAHRDETELLIAPNRTLAITAYPYFDKKLNMEIFECKLNNWES